MNRFLVWATRPGRLCLVLSVDSLDEAIAIAKRIQGSLGCPSFVSGGVCPVDFERLAAQAGRWLLKTRKGRR